MTIELNNNDTLKVVLDRKDMRRLNITFEELDYENPETRGILKELLFDAGKLTGFSAKCNQLLIEVFPAPDGGCLLYFTKLQPLRQTISSVSGLKLKKELSNDAFQKYIFEFDSCNDMLCAVDFLCLQKKFEIPTDAALYVCGKAYRLVISWNIPKTKAKGLLCEFGKFIGCGEHMLAQTNEHWKLISDNNVLKRLKAV